MGRVGLCAAVIVLAMPAAYGQDPGPFHGKTVTMIVGSSPGGGTDAYGRVIAGFLPKYLPGKPSVVVRNVPGANGITAMNFMAEQAAPDGFTITSAANTTADPLHYRKEQSRFQPSKFGIVGGAARGGEVLMIHTHAEARLHDKSVPPVVMGALGSVPRSGMQMALWAVEFLGWNVRWVVGYRSTADLLVAFERGEVDMAATGNFFQVQQRLATGKFSVLAQSGTVRNGTIVGRPDFGDAPIMKRVLLEKVTRPVERQAIEYWADSGMMDKWIALPPNSPRNILDVYRTAYGKMVDDPDFAERAKRISDDILPLSAEEVEGLLYRLENLTPEAIEYTAQVMRRQGLSGQQ